jgi:ADP-ribose pyrophosphatase YjhB (NUDIX family)
MTKDPFKHCPECSEVLVSFDDGERLRLRCPQCGWIRYRNPAVGVAVILINDEGLWLGKRRNGGWCIPCGYVEWDESIEHAALREASEETGLDLKLGDVFAVHSNFHDPERHTVGIWYTTEVDDFSKANAGGDLIELRPFPWDQLPNLIFPTDREVVGKLHKISLEG